MQKFSSRSDETQQLQQQRRHAHPCCSGEGATPAKLAFQQCAPLPAWPLVWCLPQCLHRCPPLQAGRQGWRSSVERWRLQRGCGRQRGQNLQGALASTAAAAAAAIRSQAKNSVRAERSDVHGHNSKAPSGPALHTCGVVAMQRVRAACVGPYFLQQAAAGAAGEVGWGLPSMHSSVQPSSCLATHTPLCPLPTAMSKKEPSLPPTHGERDLGGRALLQQQLVLAVEQEDGEGAVQQAAGLPRFKPAATVRAQQPIEGRCGVGQALARPSSSSSSSSSRWQLQHTTVAARR